MNEQLAAKVREFLAGVDARKSYDTMALAYRLTGIDSEHTARRLTKLAQHMPDVASHDGQTVTRGGRSWTRWRWHGTAEGIIRKATCNQWNMED